MLGTVDRVTYLAHLHATRGNHHPRTPELIETRNAVKQEKPLRTEALSDDVSSVNVDPEDVNRDILSLGRG
jgi:hypothetical protein